MLYSYYLTIFLLKIHLCSIFFYSFFSAFFCDFEQKSKKICQFFAIFSLCVSMIYEKVEKIIAQKS